MKCGNPVATWSGASFPNGNELSSFSLPLWDDQTGELLSVLSCHTQ